MCVPTPDEHDARPAAGVGAGSGGECSCDLQGDEASEEAQYDALSSVHARCLGPQEGCHDGRDPNSHPIGKETLASVRGHQESAFGMCVRFGRRAR